MALDYSRLGLENKFLGNNQAEFFAFDKFTCQQIWRRVNQPFILLYLYITSEVKQYSEALFLSYRPRTECCISQFCKTNIQDDGSTRGLLARMNNYRVTLKHNKEFIMFIFYLMVS